MTDIDTNHDAVERIMESIYFGAEWCQFHQKYYAGFNGSLYDIDTSHDLSAIMDGERFKVGRFQHADTAGYLQDCANVVPSLIDRAEAAEAERDSAKAEVYRLREALEKIAHGNPTVDCPEADASLSAQIAHATLQENSHE